MNVLQITREAKSKTGKSRQFAATYLSSIRADMLWDGGRTDTGKVGRPVYLAIAGTDMALRPFIANLRMGRRADIIKPGYRSYDEPSAVALLKSVKYDTATQRHGEVTILEFMHPDIWPVEPGMVEPDRVSFLSVAPGWWHARQMEVLAADREMTGRILGHAHRAGLPDGMGAQFTDEQLLDHVPDAARFIQYLDRRTRRPIPNDPAFYLQAYLMALGHGWASRAKNDYSSAWGVHRWAAGFVEFETARMGLRPGIVFHRSVEETDEFLAGQVKHYVEVSYHG